jgi:hypothetical protein
MKRVLVCAALLSVFAGCAKDKSKTGQTMTLRDEHGRWVADVDIRRDPKTGERYYIHNGVRETLPSGE